MGCEHMTYEEKMLLMPQGVTMDYSSLYQGWMPLQLGLNSGIKNH